MQFAVSLTGSCLKSLQRYRSTSIRAMITRIPTVAITTVRGANAPYLRERCVNADPFAKAAPPVLLLSEPDASAYSWKRYAWADCGSLRESTLPNVLEYRERRQRLHMRQFHDAWRFPSPRARCEVARRPHGKSGLDSQIYRLMARRSVLRSLPRRTRSPRS